MSYYADIFSRRPYLEFFNSDSVPSPSFVIDLEALERNLLILSSVQERTGAKVLLALKGFATYSTFPLLKKYLQGCCASSPDEARLAREEFGREVHAFAPAYSDADMEENLELCDHLVFNSFNQWQRHKAKVQASSRVISCALRVNPEHSETDVDLYNPCALGSRLGIRCEQFDGQDLSGIEGLHFHTLCQKGADALERTAKVFEERFQDILPQMKWLNFGGGHHITQPDYDIDKLCSIIEHFKNRYDLEVYLEPGEAVAINTGSLLATVLDIVEAEIPIAILDVSATCHMPDVLEMPYRPEVRDAALPQVKAHTYRLGGLSCLAGDVIGDYSFDKALEIGQKILLDDMSHYSMVKTSTFNGIRLPSICLFDAKMKQSEVIKDFGYQDYKGRLS